MRKALVALALLLSLSLPARADNVSCLIAAGWVVVGQGLGRVHQNITSISKNSTGNYTVALTMAGDFTDGMSLVVCAGAYKADADFADSSHITVLIRSLSTGALADPPNGTKCSLLAWQ